MSALAELRAKTRKRMSTASSGFLLEIRAAELALLLDALDARDEALRDANNKCRSAFAIAMREGAETNWPAFRQSLNESLNLQHSILVV